MTYMNPPFKILALAALASGVLSATAVAGLVPNGDFSSPNGDGWQENSGGGTYSFSYPDSGGNPGGYGLIDHSAGDGGFGIWVANGGETITLDSLGLSAGDTYVFSQDMMIMSGDTIGGFKVDFFIGSDFASSTGDIFPPTIGDGSTWETYNFPVLIPSDVDGIKVVPLWGAGSVIGYDNICVDPSPIPPSIPNGDFALGSAGWLEIGGDSTFEYPNEGGNPDGYGIITNGTEGNFAIWVANGGAPLALADLGLEAGQLVTFQQDMRLISGDMIGGLKIEFFDGTTFLGDTDDLRPDLIGDGSTWETYSFDVTIDPAADQIKVVPLWGPASSVGYDNISFIRPVDSIFALNIELATVLSWEAEDLNLIHQPQSSDDGIEWDDVGEAVIGDSPTSAVVTGDSQFYRVQVNELVMESATQNGGFEDEGFSDPPCADFWTCFSASNQPPTRITTDARTGDASIRIAVQNDGGGTPNNSEIQQNVGNVGGFITPGESYDFSFWAKQVSSGVSYVQNFRVQWLDGGDIILPGGTEFAPFTGGDGEWKEIKVTGLVPPAEAVTAYIQIFGATGAVAGDEARGEVLIDDLSLATVSIQPYDTIDAELADGLQLSWDTENGKLYQVQASPIDLDDFVDFGTPVSGDGQPATTSDILDPEAKFYRVQRIFE